MKGYQRAGSEQVFVNNTRLNLINFKVLW